ncbi:MAG TPA: hypothetical protein EYG51_22000, partial [Pseudomonadales bacterium]|nr:hypothetical protein [Pseudomonadales bacterium]
MKVIVTGPEKSGSRLCARVAAHVLGVCRFEDWAGYAYAPNRSNSKHGVLHRSTPYANGEILDIDQIMEESREEDVRFIFTTRDGNIARTKREDYTDVTW